jgi:hypothetical protein
MQSMRLECSHGHVVAILKAEPGEEGEAFARETIGHYDGICVYCDGKLTAHAGPIEDFHRWASREDRYHTMGAPTV